MSTQKTRDVEWIEKTQKRHRGTPFFDIVWMDETKPSTGYESIQQNHLISRVMSREAKKKEMDDEKKYARMPRRKAGALVREFLFSVTKRQKKLQKGHTITS